MLCPMTTVAFRPPLSPLKSMLLSKFSSCYRAAVTSPPRLVALSHSSAPLPHRAISTAASSAEPPAPAGAGTAAVEHVVLFKVRDGADPSLADAMVSHLRSLASLDGVLHLATVPVLRHRSSAAAALGFTHLLHSRYLTKDDLAAYSASPAHLSVVRERVFPICDDLMAVDWVGELGSGPVAPRPGSVARVTLAKLKEAAGEAGKGELLAALGEVRGSRPGAIEQFSYGENFSPERAKGYTVGSIAVLPKPEDLDGLGAEWGDLMEAQKERVRPLLDSVIVLDFLFPPSSL